MKLAKFLMFAVIAVMAVTLWLVFFRSTGMSVAPQYNQNTPVSAPPSQNRGDGPTYAEELKANTAIMEDALKRQQALQQQLDQAKAREDKEKARFNEQMLVMQQEMEKLREQANQAVNQAAGKGAEAVRQELDRKLVQMTSLVENMQKNLQSAQKQSEAKIQELESKLQSQSTAAVSIAPAAASDPQPPARRSVYATAATTTPYPSQRKANQEANPVNAAMQDWYQRMQTSRSANQQYLPQANPNAAGPLPEAQSPENWQKVFPVYTLPANSILAQSRLLTPMIGRVPLGDNNVSDPYFFRVEIGSENLAANGHRIPGVAKMIAGGYAVGVREQQCARGYIDSLTFIFIDGRIVEIGQPSSEGTSNNQALGWLSDPWGKPCIGGRYIDNASDYMKSRGAAAFLEAAAEGLSQGQVSYRQNNDGNYTAMLDGDIWRFVFGRGVAGTASEYAAYVRERTANAYDVVYVEQGVSVQIMLDRQVPIDYDAEGRKVNYYQDGPGHRHYD